MKEQLVLEGMEKYLFSKILAAVAYEESNEKVAELCVRLYNEIYGTKIPEKDMGQ